MVNKMVIKGLVLYLGITEAITHWLVKTTITETHQSTPYPEPKQPIR